MRYSNTPTVSSDITVLVNKTYVDNLTSYGYVSLNAFVEPDNTNGSFTNTITDTGSSAFPIIAPILHYRFIRNTDS